ncbi:hypothetical protein ACM9W9_05615 [Xanthomonas sacchari]
MAETTPAPAQGRRTHLSEPALVSVDPTSTVTTCAGGPETRRKDSIGSRRTTPAMKSGSRVGTNAIIVDAASDHPGLHAKVEESNKYATKTAENWPRKADASQ